MVWEKLSITPQEYFQLAVHTFPQRGCPVANWEVCHTETFHKSGLIATAYIHKENPYILIVFQLLNTDKSPQLVLPYARNFTEHVKARFQKLNCHIAYTGYAQGGSLAELCAIRDQLQAKTFDSQPIFAKSPKHNHFCNLVRYCSAPNPAGIYGNVFYIELFSHLDEGLLKRWQQALNMTHSRPELPALHQKQFILAAWENVFTCTGGLRPGSMQTLAIAQPPNYSYKDSSNSGTLFNTEPADSNVDIVTQRKPLTAKR